MADPKSTPLGSFKPVESFSYWECYYDKKTTKKGDIIIDRYILKKGRKTQKNTKRTKAQCRLEDYYFVINEQLKLIRFFNENALGIKKAVRHQGVICWDMPSLLQNFRKVDDSGNYVPGSYEMEVKGKDDETYKMRMSDGNDNIKIDGIHVTLPGNSTIKAAAIEFEPLFEDLLTQGVVLFCEAFKAPE